GRFRGKRRLRAEDGADGSGNNRHGRDGEDLVLSVPPGTVVKEVRGDKETVLADLARPGQRVTVASGGRGGWGNTRFKSSTNQAPKIAQRGEPGEEKTIVLEMRLIADVGIIGYPNAGKSTLLAAASHAKPKIADYPFTTLEPVLGVVEVGSRSFVMAEIPGLIEGAHLGRGLGHDFLRHAMRTRIFVHLLSGTSASPLDDMLKVNRELALFDPELGRRRQIVAVNKIDLPEVRARLAEIQASLAGHGITPWLISAATGEGVAALMQELARALEAESRPAPEEREVAPVAVFRPAGVRARFKVSRIGDEFIIEAPELERLHGGPNTGREELIWQLDYQLRRLGIDRALERAGAQAGARLRLGDFTWEWVPKLRKKQK
ncbi:MAG: GTPase ObgE, partial [Dehalococcoidales bacterium]|nr:GTPase ObgE [Dehalococcoidales bacterium]